LVVESERVSNRTLKAKKQTPLASLAGDAKGVFVKAFVKAAFPRRRLDPAGMVSGQIDWNSSGRPA
jgi:hypothetical protein